jgi:hypothetical protein
VSTSVRCVDGRRTVFGAARATEAGALAIDESEFEPVRDGLERGEGAVLAGERSSDGERRELMSIAPSRVAAINLCNV